MKVTDPKTYNRFISLIWLLLWLNFVTQYWFDSPPQEALLAPTLFILAVYPLTTYLSTTLLRKAMITKRWGLFMFQFLFISAIFGAILCGALRLFVYLETIGFFNSDFFSGMGSPLHEVVNISLSAVVINFGFCGLRFFEANIKLQNELLGSQLKTLNGQINPHSMFNILNHIHVLLQKDPQAADELLLQYSDILRYQLYNANKEKVSIKQDTDYLKQYLEVEKVRWKNKITVTDLWRIENNELTIPPLLFITFVENAFKHVARSDTNKGYVNISFIQSGQTIRFEVENSKPNIKTSPKDDSGLGLPNIRKRLNILFPNRHRLLIEESDATYYTQLTLTF